MTGNKREEQGFALLIVLMVLVALSLMIGAVVSATRGYANETMFRLGTLKLRAGLDGATATIGHELSEPALQGVSLDTSRTIEIGTVSVQVVIRPELAKADINMADPQLIEQLLRVAGLTQKVSHRIADEVVDWRAPPQNTSRAVQAADYIAAGRGYMPPHRNFETLSDLSLLLDGSDDLVTCLEPDITLYTRSRDIDLSTASNRLRQAVNAVLPSAQARNSAVSLTGVLGSAYGRPDLYEITETARDDTSHMTMTRQLVMRITGDPHDPYWILAATSPAPSAEEAALACQRVTSADRY